MIPSSSERGPSRSMERGAFEHGEHGRLGETSSRSCCHAGPLRDGAVQVAAHVTVHVVMRP